MALKFSELNLHPSLMAGITKLGFEETTPIQELTMPHVLEGRDVAGLAQTGTGKTAAFLLPIMERIVRSRLNPDQLSPEEKELREKRMLPDWRPNQFVLVLVPTRELCEQVYESAVKLAGPSELRAASIYGGVAYEKQKEALRNGVEFIIATPGRLIDLYKEHLVDLKQVRAIIFDEADRMFDMGFKDDMKFILQRVPKERQFLVFSATLNLDVLNTAYQFGANPVEVNVSRDQAKAENVEDKIIHVGQDEKASHLLSLLKLHNPRQAIIFSNFKMNVPRLAQFLSDNGVPAVGISSLLTQSQRNRVMEQFKGSSEHNVLVATDVAARGLDIKGVDMVVNYELPDDPENYVHRIGRTGRAGEKGIAFSLVSDRDVDALTRVEQYLKHKVTTDFLEESQLVKEFKAMQSDRPDRGPRPQGGGGRGEGRGPGRGGPRGESRGGGGRGGRDGGRPERGPRGPRPEGEQRAEGQGGGRRDQRGPRPQGPKPQAAQAGGEQKQGGGRRDQQGRRDNREQRPGQPGRGGEGRRDNRGPRDQRHAGQNGNGNGKHQHGRRDGKPRSGPIPKGQTPPPKTIGAKVGGFFKKLFGG
ncbi:MAG TPA: DEAD/DEAH box helicase [Bdellovibrionales bacterium]|nr:DEAD/DEAH box helicase [Bdellovibrionales bacterium]